MATTSFAIAPSPKTRSKTAKGLPIDPNAHPGVKIQSPISDYLATLVSQNSKDNPGANAAYIPELAAVNSDQIGACITTVDGYVYGAGATSVEFSIQSVSKPFVYALAIEEHGLDWVLKRVDVEPSGEAFNELSLDGEQLPKNPMINAGAMTTHSLIGEGKYSVDERFEHIRKGLSAFAGRDLGVDEGSYKSEIATAFRNFSIAYMLRNYGAIKGDPGDVVKGYTRQCAIRLTAEDLAQMGATLANGGKQPVTGVQVVSPETVRQVLSVMTTCGMYNEAGHWVCEVGFPGKSGVSGCVLGVLPGNLGMATFSPRLDVAGNSVRGVRMYKQIAKEMVLHMMLPPPPARTVIRRDYLLRSAEGEKIVVVSLMGAVNFTATERIVRVLQSRTAAQEAHTINGLVVDVRRVDQVYPVASRILAEALRRLRATGHKVVLVDPGNILLGELGKGSPTGIDTAPGDDAAADEIIGDTSQFESDKWERIPFSPQMMELD
ncbi:hypothetical protein Q8F55_000784 [Vanrija albida]|uniref:glutaminase n=1 Tax=Vanrija albida TaxID=181172 RepID=A0ABR3QEA1_9TREE